MGLCRNVPALCQAFFVVDFDAIFACVGPQCDFRGSEHYIFYWKSVFCDPLEEFYPELEVLSLPIQEMLWDPFSPLLAGGVIL